MRPGSPAGPPPRPDPPWPPDSAWLPRPDPGHGTPATRLQQGLKPGAGAAQHHRDQTDQHARTGTQQRWLACCLAVARPPPGRRPSAPARKSEKPAREPIRKSTPPKAPEASARGPEQPRSTGRMTPQPEAEQRAPATVSSGVIGFAPCQPPFRTATARIALLLSSRRPTVAGDPLQALISKRLHPAVLKW